MSLDLKAAEAVFRSAISEVQKNWTPSFNYSEQIKSVVLGSHKTYRYILVNALLAKATDDSINPLTLQAQSKLQGAYDARSLCHKVLVKIERELLDNCLGGSNEPFLNKPARFAELSLKNNVRKGSDTETLKLCITVLTNVTTRKQALTALKDALHFSIQRKDLNKVEIGELGEETSHYYIQMLADKLLSESVGGEVCAILSAIALDLYFYGSKSQVKISIHPVNQSGASSKEIGDVDVYIDSKLTHSAEIKDKVFTAEDVDHAANKCFSKGFSKVLFILGPRASVQSVDLTEIIQKWTDKKFEISVFQLSNFLFSTIALSSFLSFEIFIEKINQYAKASRASDYFYKHLQNCLKSIEESD